MGIRIKKVLGYGLVIEPGREEEILNLDALQDRFEKLPLSGFRQFLQARYSYTQDSLLRMMMNEEDDENLNLGWQCIHPAQDEYTPGSSLHLAIIPPSMVDEWRHNDDPIDYYETISSHSGTDNPMSPAIKFLDHGIYPFGDYYRNVKTGQSITTSKRRDIKDLSSILTDDEEGNPDAHIQKLYREIGVANHEEFETLIQPGVPEEVKYFAEYAKLFKEPETVNSLRPALLTYWS